MSEAAERLLAQARHLWAGRFQGILSTQSQAHPGYPFGSLVPYCLDTNGQPLLLLSHLAQHTRNLLADPRCAFTVTEATHGDVQQSLRITCLGQCRPAEEALDEALERYFRYFPESRPYLEQLNFRLFRLDPQQAHLNGGFATARWAGPERLIHRHPFSGEEELRLLEQIAVGAETPLCRRLLDTHAEASPHASLRIVGVDASGIDVRLDGRLLRVALAGTATGKEQILELLGQPR